ncbi:MAG: hypothetical protein ACFE91_08580 [Promethearchaeota archaeon]
MSLLKKEIIQICEQYLPTYKKSIYGLKYEPKGIFYSEMLLFIAISKKLGVNLLIESGRARGQSTKIIAENFKEQSYQIKSVEFVKYSSDVKISYNRLKEYKNIDLIFGNSFEILPKLVREECCVLIDGPKSGAINLAIDMLKNPLVKAIFIHDMHKDSIERNEAEKIFKDCFFTDDLDYVNKFKNLDKKAWLDQRKHREFQSWAPYKKDNKIMKSYASTLMLIFNSGNAFNLTQATKLSNKRFNKKRKRSLKKIIENWPSRIKNIISFPVYYIFYEKRIKNSQKLNKIAFIKIWFSYIYITLKGIFQKK